MAAAPVFQAAQCATGVRQVSANMFNAMPSTIFGIMESFLLAPIQFFLSAAFTSP
jgi:TRAP-type mannitol/chloroaromatic compound transport system permease large subunit